jgi:hypothetical protein
MSCRIVADMLAGFDKCVRSTSSGTKNKNIHFYKSLNGGFKTIERQQ